MEEALRYIENNYAHAVNIQVIADYLNIERTYLYRLFKDITKTSPQEYLLDFRIRRACTLLRETALPIGDIARSVGYEDALYFSRLFKQKKDQTPTDYRFPAVEIPQGNGSRISDFRYQAHRISEGKPALKGLPATYTEENSEAKTLTLYLKDAVTGVELELLYTIFAQDGIMSRSARLINSGNEPVHLLKAMSLCLDLPDCHYQWIQFSGAWARERHPGQESWNMASSLSAACGDTPPTNTIPLSC